MTMIANVLFLDDDEERHREFFLQWQAHGWKTRSSASPRTGEEAIALMRAQRFELVFLDHDLAVGHYAEHSGGGRAPARRAMDGTDVVREILMLPPERQPRVAVVHSWNRHGALRMVSELTAIPGIRQVWRPFGPGLVEHARDMIAR